MASFKVVDPSDPDVTATVFVDFSLPIGIAADPGTKLAEALLARDVDSEELSNIVSGIVVDWIDRFGEEELGSMIERILFDRSPERNCVIHGILHLSCYHLPRKDWEEIQIGTLSNLCNCWTQGDDRQSVIVDIRGLSEEDFGIEEEDDEESYQYSKALIECIKFAQSRCVDHIRFDEAGILVRELEKFKHC